MIYRLLPVVVAAVMSLAACGTDPVTSRKEPGGVMHTASARAPGFDLENFDTSVGPGEDFFRYVNGGWLDRTEIPEDKSNYGSFTELFDKAETDLRAIIDAAATSRAPDGSTTQKIGSMYRSFMDVQRIAALGLRPLHEPLAAVENVTNHEELARTFGHLSTLGVSSPLLIYIDQDAGNTTEYIPLLHQSGLGLPDRDYYFDEQERFVETRAKYRDYIGRILGLAGFADPAGTAQRIMALETRMADAQWTRVRNRDRNATYNRYSLSEAQALAPGFALRRMLEGAGITDLDAVVVRQPDYLTALGKLDVPLADWRDYLKFRIIDAYAPYLPDSYVEAHFDLHDRTLTGVEQMRPRWKRGVEAVEFTMGEALGEIYVRQHFRPEAKTRMDELVENLRRVFAEAIDELEWMGPETRAEAHAKLASFTTKIGYPKKWKDYSSLRVSDNALIANLMASTRLEHQREIGKLGGPIDRDEWFMTPQTINAYYNPSMNEIVFPAAILQPPFFNVAADDAVNYGAIGAVIGHEFSHGFDDQGRKSDGTGTLRDWWTEADEREFKRRAQGLVDQYNEYSPLEGMNVNGELTLGENIGDLAGLTMAHRAYRLSLGGRPAPVIAGFKGDQRFFIGWAQVWRRKYREDELRRRLVTDPHSPSRYRVLGIVSNMDPFYSAFAIDPEDPIYRAPADRVRIW